MPVTRGSRLRARDSVRRVLLLCLQVFSVVSCPAVSRCPTFSLQSATLPQDFRTGPRSSSFVNFMDSCRLSNSRLRPAPVQIPS
ncbi:hypothetical protein C8R45DRAFT_1013062 [Mycena sanguinolenta]|nr:hypothetical protein C8R45DRAFT_1013062 [Mycena sanguinolenta]